MSRREMSDPRVQARLKRLEEERAEQQRLSLRRLMEDPENRAVLARLIESLKGGRLWCPGAEIHRAVGRHDAAVELEEELAREVPELFEAMQRETIDRKAEHRRLMEAARIPGAEDGRRE